ncbi:hypothetical protein EDB86DRAFT_2828036 [Lactarius hatsudake]|nr:hypothetical protein EDB86DRAFT_2828036 [Lactarius hatsudake]
MVEIGDSATGNVEQDNLWWDLDLALDTDRLNAQKAQPAEQAKRMCVLSVNEGLSFLPFRARPHASPQNPICQRSNTLRNHHHTSASALLNTEDVEASVAAAKQMRTCSLAQPTSRTAPFCRQTGHRQHGAEGGAGMAGQLRRNAEHVSGALAAGEKAGAILDVMKWERFRWGDGKRSLTLS